MANKSIIAVVLLLCVADIIEVQAYTRTLIGSDSISSRGGIGGTQTFYYHVPPRAVAVTYTENNRRGSGSGRGFFYSRGRFGARGYGTVKLTWSRGDRMAKIRAEISGTKCGYSCPDNRISWWVHAYVDN